VRTILKKDNSINTLLTRDSDTGLTLVERNNLAAQLQADLFISIHVNSSGVMNSSASGIETFYLEEEKLLPPTRQGGWIFVNLKKDKKLIQLIDQLSSKNISESQKLAQNIQKNLLSLLKEKNIPAIDRGVKKNLFRVLFPNEVPSILVEVGFLTNQEECYKLTQVSYRNHLAQGICNGIQSFIKEYQKIHN
jgi:N-acetylmuramoyl-L-alanine amidase